MKVLIIEDEIVAAKRMQEMLLAYDSDIEIVGIIDSVLDAINFLSKSRSVMDVILMDIQLSDGLCFEIFEKIEVDCPIIFTSAYDQYTLKAFKVNSVDYLLKPIEASELKASIDRFRKLHINKVKSQIDLPLLGKILKANSYRYRFLVKTSNGFIPISTQNIAYFYSEDKLTFLMTREGNRHLVDMSLEELSCNLDPNDFFKISRNFIVHHKAVKEIQYHLNNRLKLKLIPPIDKDVFISRNHTKNFKEWMNN